MKIKYNSIAFFPVFLLLLFPEYSIQTSLHLEKKSCHTIYLCKTYLGLGVSDWIIVLMGLILIFCILHKGYISIDKSSTFYKVVQISIIYLIIGAIYNLTVIFNLISYLYDFKLFLYFIVIYFWLKQFGRVELEEKHIIYFFIIGAIGSLWDYYYVSNFGVIQRPNLLPFIPVIMPLIEPNYLILLMICFKQHRWWLSFLFIFEILSLFNQATLGGFYGLGMAIVFILIYQKKFTEKLIFIILFFSFIFLLAVLPLILYEVLPMISDIKSDGLDIRKMKTLSVLDNYFMNIPIIIGKGLGSTYFETFTSDYTNVFSTGVHFTEGNVKFVMHTPLALFYKFGLVGTFAMMYILIKTSVKLFKLSQFKNDNMAKFLSISYPLIIMGSLITPGILKNALMVGIFIFISDQKLQKIKNKFF